MLTRFFLAVVVLSGCTSQKGATKLPEPGITAIKNDIAFLADDKLEGRRTGTAGEKAAAAYIATAFEKAGLQPKGSDGYFQDFPVTEGKMVQPSTLVYINGAPLQLDTDFFPLAFSANGTIDASPSVSLMEKGEPWFYNLEDVLGQNKANPHFDVAGAVMAKATDAGKKGATALFVYNTSNQTDGLQFDAKDKTAASTIPVLYITKDAAKKFFKDVSASVNIKAEVAIGEATRTGRNVIGYVDNGAATTVVLGAHYDHLGYGEDRNSRFTGTDKQIHNGADDNASGTAALLELARMLKGTTLKKNNYLFAAFSGEELGLFGSKYFTQHTTIELSSVNYMINMDMVGRLNDSSKALTVGGYGTSPEWGLLYGAASTLYKAGEYRFDSSGTGPSDHTSFYLKNIPVLFYFTGLHTDYHKPSDDFDKINYNGEAAIIKHVYSLLQATDKMAARVAFTKTREAQMTSTARFSVTLGIMPDYTYSGAGVRADGISEGKAAQKAGLQAGDIITAIGNYKVASMESYMQTLGKFKKGDKTIVTYARGGKPFTTTVEF